MTWTKQTSCRKLSLTSRLVMSQPEGSFHAYQSIGSRFDIFQNINEIKHRLQVHTKPIRILKQMHCWQKNCMKRHQHGNCNAHVCWNQNLIDALQDLKAVIKQPENPVRIPEACQTCETGGLCECCQACAPPISQHFHPQGQVHLEVMLSWLLTVSLIPEINPLRGLTWSIIWRTVCSVGPCYEV